MTCDEREFRVRVLCSESESIVDPINCTRVDRGLPGETLSERMRDPASSPSGPEQGTWSSYTSFRRFLVGPVPPISSALSAVYVPPACSQLVALEHHVPIDRIPDWSSLSITGRRRQVAVQVGQEWDQTVGIEGGESRSPASS